MGSGRGCGEWRKRGGREKRGTNEGVRGGGVDEDVCMGVGGGWGNTDWVDAYMYTNLLDT